MFEFIQDSIKMSETKEIEGKIREFAEMVERFEVDQDLPPHQKLKLLETFMTENPFPSPDQALLKQSIQKAERLKRTLATQIRFKQN